jgi:sugar-specific transcriptional regulator TrmB
MLNISDYLKKLGLSEIEASIYKGLLEKGSCSIMELANYLGMKRITVHFNVENLIKKGLIAQTKIGARRRIIAEAPEKLSFLLKQQEENLKSLQEDFPTALKAMSSLFNKNSQVSLEDVEVLYYKGSDSFKQVSQRSIDNAKDEILFISNLDQWYNIYTKDLDEKYYIPERLKRDIKLKILTFESDKTKSLRTEDKKLAREIKFLPKEMNFNTTIMIYGEEVSLMISHKPYNSIVIRDKDFHKTFSNIFNALWLIAEKS